MKTTLGMAKVNLRHARMPQLTAGIGFAIGILTYAISFLIDNSNGQNLAVGNCLFCYHSAWRFLFQLHILLN